MTKFPLASIPATKVRLVHSAVAQQDYLISIALPSHYAEHPEKVWPVISFPVDRFGVIPPWLARVDLPNLGARGGPGAALECKAALLLTAMSNSVPDERG